MTAAKHAYPKIPIQRPQLKKLNNAHYCYTQGTRVQKPVLSDPLRHNLVPLPFAHPTLS